MRALKSIALAGLAAASLSLIPVKLATALDYYAAYGMYRTANGTYHSSNGYVEYIIQHESSGRPWVSNYLGCIGLMQSCPGRTPRIIAISAVTLWPGRTPPLPGLAPWDSFTSMPRTFGAPSSVLISTSVENAPSAERQPK